MCQGCVINNFDKIKKGTQKQTLESLDKTGAWDENRTRTGTSPEGF